MWSDSAVTAKRPSLLHSTASIHSAGGLAPLCEWSARACTCSQLEV